MMVCRSRESLTNRSQVERKRLDAAKLFMDAGALDELAMLDTPPDAFIPGESDATALSHRARRRVLVRQTTNVLLPLPLSQ
jgi:hypothetical protein